MDKDITALQNEIDILKETISKIKEIKIVTYIWGDDLKVNDDLLRATSSYTIEEMMTSSNENYWLVRYKDKKGVSEVHKKQFHPVFKTIGSII